MQKRRDRNQLELVRLWEQLGGTFADLSQLPGVLDGIAGIAGVDQRVEIKDGKKPPSARKLTEKEADVFQTWRGRRPVIWESGEDVIRTRDEMVLEQRGERK